jgi:F-type H+-transporting ATPase subunit b
MADFSILAAAVEAAADHAEEPTALWLTPGGWVAATMIALVVLAIYLKVPGMIGGMLDRKIGEIRHLLDEATKLRAEAEALKAELQAKLANAAKEAAALKASAEEEAKLLVAKARADAEALVARREKMAEEKIAAAERSAIAELRAKASDAAAVAARGLIVKNHSATADKALVDEAISSI